MMVIVIRLMSSCYLLPKIMLITAAVLVMKPAAA